VDIADNMVQLESLTKTSASLRLGKSASAATLGNAASSATLRHSVSAAAMPHRSMHGSGMMSQTSLSGGLGMSFSNDGLSVVQREMNALVYNTAVTRMQRGEIVATHKQRNWRDPGRREQHHFDGATMRVVTPAAMRRHDQQMAAKLASINKPYVLSQVFPSDPPPMRAPNRGGRSVTITSPSGAADPSLPPPRDVQTADDAVHFAPSGAPSAAPSAAPQHPKQLSRQKTRKLSALDEQVSHYHKLLRHKINARFSTLRRVFRQIDADASGSCDRDELKYMLNAMFNLRVPDAAMERMIDLADYDGDGNIKFDEFARVFTAEDIFNMKKTLSAVDMTKYGLSEVGDERAPLDPRKPLGEPIRAHHSHFPAGTLIATNDTLTLDHSGGSGRPLFIPRVLTSSHGRGAGFKGHESPPYERFLSKPRNTALPAGKSSGGRVPLTLEWPLNLEDNKEFKEVAVAAVPNPVALPPVHAGGAVAM